MLLSVIDKLMYSIDENIRQIAQNICKCKELIKRNIVKSVQSHTDDMV